MKLLVDKFPSSTQINDLFRLFMQYGEVCDVVIWRNRRTGRRWGIIELEGDDDAERAIDELDGFPWRGKTLQVKETFRRSHREGS